MIQPIGGGSGLLGRGTGSARRAGSTPASSALDRPADWWRRQFRKLFALEGAWGFDSFPIRLAGSGLWQLPVFACVAQLVERVTRNDEADGSSPSACSVLTVPVK